ncbi:MAG: hypothetical protein K6C94_04590 [Candidatus Gastranaerophilales bacterium]|nr:hypothetical protein [Candidatus Gastranaerophilales bacterium]
MKNKILLCLLVMFFAANTAFSADNFFFFGNQKYTNCEIGDFVGDDVRETKYKNFLIQYPSASFSEKQTLIFAVKCAKEGVKTQYQMDCCLRCKMFPHVMGE